MEHSRELKKPLQDLVWEVKGLIDRENESDEELKRVYKTHKERRKTLEKLSETTNTLVLQYMAKGRGDDAE